MAFTAALAISGMAVPDAGALDLTGAWSGQLGCSAFDGQKETAKLSSAMKIVQTGTSAVMSLDDQDFYVGGTIDDQSKPATACCNLWRDPRPDFPGLNLPLVQLWR